MSLPAYTHSCSCVLSFVFSVHTFGKGHVSVRDQKPKQPKQAQESTQSKICIGTRRSGTTAAQTWELTASLNIHLGSHLSRWQSFTVLGPKLMDQGHRTETNGSGSQSTLGARLGAELGL